MATSTIKGIYTSSTSYANGTVVARRRGDVITVDINILEGLVANQWNTVATLDEQYRPSTTKNFVIVNNAASSASSVPLQLRIGTSGVVNIYTYSSSVTPQGTATYII